jgi:hypothetical protein
MTRSLRERLSILHPHCSASYSAPVEGEAGRPTRPRLDVRIDSRVVADEPWHSDGTR